MDRLLCAFVFIVVFAVAASASVSGSSPLLSGVLTGQKKHQQQVPVQPVEGEEEVKEESTVVLPALEDEQGSGAVASKVTMIEEEQVKKVDEDQCGDVSGVWQSRTSATRLIIVQGADGDLSGLFRYNNESGWYELKGQRGTHLGSALAFSVVWQEGTSVSSVAGHCHSCSQPTLELHGVYSRLLPECKSHVVSITNKYFNKVGDSAAAHALSRSIFGEETVEQEAQGQNLEQAAADNGSGDE